MNAIPMLPDGSRSLGHRIQPGRVLFSEQQIVGQFRLSMIAQYMQQIRSPYESRLQTMSACPNLLANC